MYGYYITQKGADLMAQAVIDESKVTITQCAVGDGGDAEAEKDLSRTALNNETYRKSFDIEDSYALAPDDTDTVMIECIIPSEAGELTVSEIGFFDDADNLIAYGVLKEQVLGSDSDGLEYSLDIVSFIELTSEQLSVLKVDLGKANVQAISERVDEFESTVNTTVDEFKTNVNGQLDGFRKDIKNLDLGTELKEKVDELEDRIFIREPAYLCSGPNFNSKIKALDGFDNVRSLIFTKDSPPVSASLTDFSRDEDNSVVAWVDGTTAYISAYGKIIYAYRASSFYFNNLKQLTNIDLSNFDTSQSTNMTSIFSGCTGLSNLDLSNFNTSQVTIMNSMFSGCTGLNNLDLSNFDTSNLNEMGFMFSKCTSLTSLDLSNFDTSKITKMHYMFDGCTNLTSLNLSSFDLSSITWYNDADYIFRDCENLKTIYAQDWTAQCPVITDTYGVFRNCTALPSYDSANKTGEYAKLISDGGYFTDPSEAPPKPEKPPKPAKEKTLEERIEDLENGSGGTESETFETVKLKAEYIGQGLSVDEAQDNKVIFTNMNPPDDVSPIDCSEGGDSSVVKWYSNNTIYVSSKKAGTKIELPITYQVLSDESDVNDHFSSIYGIMTVRKEYTEGDYVRREVVESSITGIDFTNAHVAKNSSLDRMFNGCSNLKSIDLTLIDDCQPISLERMFGDCSNLISVNLGDLDVSKVTSVFFMFYYCENLKYLYCDNDWTTNENINSSNDMFPSCTKLSGITVYDSSGEHAKPISMGGCFSPKPTIDSLEKRVQALEEAIKNSTNLIIDVSATGYPSGTTFTAEHTDGTSISGELPLKVTKAGTWTITDSYSDFSDNVSVKDTFSVTHNLPVLTVTTDIGNGNTQTCTLGSTVLKQTVSDGKATFYLPKYGTWVIGYSGSENTVNVSVNSRTSYTAKYSVQTSETYHIVVNNASDVLTFYVHESADRNGAIRKSFKNSSYKSTFTFDLVLTGTEVNDIEEQLWLLNDPIRTVPGDATYGVSGNGIRMGYSFEDGKTYTYDWNNASRMSESRNY